MNNDLEAVPNIGPVLAQRLRSAGITSRAELLQLGDEAAFQRLRATLPEDACRHTRLALAGAVRGLRWQHLDPAARADLTRDLP